MGLTFKRDDSLERMFDEFAFDPDKTPEFTTDEEIQKKENQAVKENEDKDGE